MAIIDQISVRDANDNPVLYDIGASASNVAYDSSTDVKSKLDTKVDKETGKGLSTNDYTTAEKNKLAGIAAGAEVNQNTFSNVKVGSTTIAADGKTDTLELIAGTNVTLTPDATNDTITISMNNSGTGTVTSVATGAGLTGGPITSSGTIKANLKSETASTLAAADKGSTANREYAVGLDSNNKLSVNVPWTDTTYSNATTSASGLMSSSDKTKLDGIASGAEVNQNAFNNIDVTQGSTTTNIAADTKTDKLTLVGGTNITLTADATNDKITIAAKDTTYSNATTSAAGLMSSTDKIKLDGIASGAEVNVQSDLNQTTNTADDFIKNKPTLGTAAAKNFITSVTSGSADLVTSGAVWTAIDNLPEPMIFKGSLGTGGTITTLPTASSANQGYTYKVITAGTYASQAAKVGDLFISDGTAWVYIPSADEPSGTVTSVGISNGGGLSISGSPITSSGTITITNTGVRAIAQGATNGTINVNTNGSTAEVAVKGLGSLAYKSSLTKSDVGLGNVANLDQSKAIKTITRSGTTFTATAIDGTTSSFTQQDNNTWTAMVGATSAANGSVGYVNATPPKDGYNTKYLRADGTWTVPPDNNTWRGIQNNLTSDSTTESLSAAQGKALANGSARDNTKVAKAGDTMTGNLTIKRTSSNADNTPAEIALSAVDSTNSVTSTGTIRAYQAGVNGANFVISPSGNMFLGSGEAANAHYNLYTHNEGEVLYLTSDNQVHIQANGQTIANRKGLQITNNAEVIPDVADVATNNTGSIGTSSYKWANGYFTNINGVAVGTPKFTDTTYSGANGISLSGTTFSNSGVRSIAQGTANGTINVNTNGSTADVSVKGLAALAYKASLGKSDVGLGNVANIDQSKAIKSITRSGTTFTATALDGTTSSFTQQDNNTTYTGANGISLSGTTFSNSGVRSIASGTANGTINVNTNGSTVDVAVKGLGSNAYTSTSYLPLAGGTMTGRITTAKPNTLAITGSGTAAQDKGSGVSPRYFPAKWTFNTGLNPVDGDVITIKVPVAGHDFGTFLSINNGTSYHPIATNGNGRLTGHYPVGERITLVFKADGQVDNVYAAAGADARTNVTGGSWSAVNFYDSGNNYHAVCFTAAATAAKTATASLYVLRAHNRFTMYITNSNTSASALTLNINGTGAKPIYINGSASSASNYTLNAGAYEVYYNGTNYYLRTDAYSLGNCEGTASNVRGTVAVANGGTGATSAANALTNLGIGNVKNYDQSKAIKSITRSGTTFTATALDGTTTSFTQQDNNTTYTGANGISLSGTTFSNSGVRSIAQGTTNGTINVNTNGSTANVAVKGLGAMAYKASVSKSDVGLGNVANYDQSKAIKTITRSGTTFTATAIDGTTSSFTQQDNNTTYSNATTAAAGLMSAADKVKLNGIQTGANTMSKKRYTITASSWSSSASGGYYSYTLTLSSPTLNTGYPPNVYLSGSADSTPATATEQTAYALLDYCNLTAASTLMLYASTKPTATFYVYVEGVSA